MNLWSYCEEDCFGNPSFSRCWDDPVSGELFCLFDCDDCTPYPEAPMCPFFECPKDAICKWY